MAFGQVTGPPASGRQIKDLLALLEAAGHDGFRDARGPMGFTQRQAGGKFTAPEAAAFIEQLEAANEGGDPGGDGDGAGGSPAPNVVPLRPAAARRSPAAKKATGTGAAAGTPAGKPVGKPVGKVAPARLSAADEALRRFSTEKLVGELRRRGYTVTEP